MKQETERLFLREMTPDDFDALYAVLADSDIMQHYPYTFDEARVRNWINKNRERYRVFGFGLWAVCLKATGELIGDCGLTMQNIGSTILPEIGYHIAKAYQHQGYAKEAARAVRDWTFANTTFGAVYSYMKKANVPSSAVARANGMTLLGEFTDDEDEQTVVYGIRREESEKHMDIWERLYERAKKEYHPEEVSPFIQAHHVVCALESEDGTIYTGFCIEACSGVMNLCAERVAALNMYVNSGQTKIKRLIAFRDRAPYGGGSGMPCGACREFLYQLNEENESMEIMVDYESRRTVTLKELLPDFWGKERYSESHSIENNSDRTAVVIKTSTERDDGEM